MPYSGYWSANRPRFDSPRSRIAFFGVPVLVFATFMASSPTARISDGVIDVGPVRRGEVVQRSVVITNAGLRALDLPSEARTCGVRVSVPRASERVGRGAAVPVRVEIDTSLFPEGPSVKEVGLPTSDPFTPTLRLMVRADVRSDLDVTPRILRLSPEAPAAIAELRVMANGDVKPLSIRATDRRVTAGLEAGPGADNRVFVVRTQVDPSRPLPWNLGTVVIHTTSPVMPELRIPVRGTLTTRR